MKTRRAKIETTSETRWRELSEEWQDAAVKAVVDAGYGDTPMAVVAAIACALWEVGRFDER